MPKYRKRPVVIEAVQITRPMTVTTPEGTMNGNPGDWLITGVKGEQYFCKDDIFQQTYEPAEDKGQRARGVIKMGEGNENNSR